MNYVNFSIDVSSVASYLYRHLGEQMPPQILDSEGNVNVQADNELLEQWSASRDAFSIDVNRIERFLNDLDILCTHILNENDREMYMVHVYNAAKSTFDQDKTQIRTWFMWLYLIMFGYPNGPRWGDFIQVCGPRIFVDRLSERMGELV